MAEQSAASNGRSHCPNCGSTRVKPSDWAAGPDRVCEDCGSTWDVFEYGRPGAISPPQHEPGISNDLRDLLVDCRTALADWGTSHAPEFCGEENVAAALGRIQAVGTLAYAGALISRITHALEQVAHERPPAPPWVWEFGRIHFHSIPGFADRLHHILNDCRAASVISDIWLNDIGQVLKEFGYTMTITRDEAPQATDLTDTSHEGA